MLAQELTLRLNGEVYSAQNIRAKLQAYRSASSETKSKEEEIHEDVLIFLHEWFTPSPEIEIQTSGSTGKAKRLKASKEAMLSSAEMTCTFLGFGKETNALLCISPKYIGGMMMIVRAMLYNMHLSLAGVQSNPLLQVDEQIDFIALVPMQVQAILDEPSSKDKLKAISQVIIGGASLNDKLLKELKGFPNAIYSTYGMTETLSHIALRRLSGKGASILYQALPNIQLNLSEKGTLSILAPYIYEEWLHTNDIVKLNEDNSFEVIGRIDNVVNSGGVKLQIEVLEEEIRKIIPQPFALTSVPDERLGNALVLLLQDDTKGTNKQEAKRNLLNKLKKALPPYSAPKDIIYCTEIPLTENAKVDRGACRKLAQSSAN